MGKKAIDVLRAVRKTNCLEVNCYFSYILVYMQEIFSCV